MTAGRITRKGFLKGMLAAGAATVMSVPARVAAAAAPKEPAVGDPGYDRRVSELFARARTRRP